MTSCKTDVNYYLLNIDFYLEAFSLDSMNFT